MSNTLTSIAVTTLRSGRTRKATLNTRSIVLLLLFQVFSLKYQCSTILFPWPFVGFESTTNQTLNPYNF